MAGISQDGHGGLIVTGDQNPTNAATTEFFRNGKWTLGPDMPSRRWGHCQVLLGDTVYVVGGYRYNPDGGFLASTLLLIQDSYWLEVGSLAVARDSFACAVHDGKIFVIGGDSYQGYLSSVEVLDPDTNTWSSGPEFPQTVTHAQAFSWNGYLWLMGGYMGPVLTKSRKNSTSQSEYNKVIYRLEGNIWKDTGIIVDENSPLPAQIVKHDVIDCHFATKSIEEL